MKEEHKRDIFETIDLIMKEVPAIGKTKQNTKQNYKFRGIDDVMNKLQPIFSKYKLFVVPEVLEQTREERKTSMGGTLLYSICKIKYTFYAEDGSHVEATVIGEGMDSGDKASNKAMAIAFKYALFQVFCIPTEELKDPDKEKVAQSYSSQQILKLNAEFKELLIETDTDPDEIYKYFGIKNDTEMSPKQLIATINKLKTKEKKVKKEVF